MSNATPRSLGGELHELVALIDRGAAMVLGDDELTYRRYYLLTGVAQLGAPTQHELAAHVGLSDAAVSRMLVTLSSAGLVESRVDPGHRRRNTVRLTDTGRRLEREVGSRLDGALSALLGSVGVDETGFHGLVTRLRIGMREWIAAVERGEAGPPATQDGRDPASTPASSTEAGPKPERSTAGI